MEYAPQPNKQESPYKELMAQLEAINNVINNGRKSSVMSSIIFYLERGDFVSARAVTATDSDKLWQYDDDGKIEALLRESGLLV